MSLPVFLLVAFVVVAIKESNGSPTSSCFAQISWSPCPELPEVQCASYEVPLDYAQPTAGKATLALARIQATTTPKLGSLLVNPGGPGDGGVEFVQTLGSAITLLTNGQYDVIGWDPRGVGNSSPQLSCGFEDASELSGFFNGTIINSGVEAQGNFTNPHDIAQFYATVGQTDERLNKFGQKCQAKNSFLKYMGTTAVVRDMVSIADCLDGPTAPIHYYGKSYGTVIGAYFVNMFPKRVGRVIIDGVVDSILWSTRPSYEFLSSSFRDTDFVLESFAGLCAASGPSNCSIARENSTGASILTDIRHLIDETYTSHKLGHSNTSSFDIRTLIYNELSTPTTWDKHIADQLDPLESGSATFNNGSRSFASSKRDVAPVDPELVGKLATAVIPCLDSINQEHISTRRVYDEVLRVTQHVTRFFGELTPALFLFNCHRFPVRAVERFSGPFNAKLANPVLVIGNKGDPKTPLANARKLAETLGSSARLLQHDGFGHTSFTMTSDCTISTMRQYLLTGELPANGQICPTNQALFPPNATLATALIGS